MDARALIADLAGAGLSITAESGRLVIRPASKLTDPLRALLREAKHDLLSLLVATSQPEQTCGPLPAAVPDGGRARFLNRRARLLRWGWPDCRATHLAERLAQRDREQDERVSCADCRHARADRCVNHRHAGLNGPALGPDLVALPQRCPGFRVVAQDARADCQLDDEIGAEAAVGTGPGGCSRGHVSPSSHGPQRRVAPCASSFSNGPDKAAQWPRIRRVPCEWSRVRQGAALGSYECPRVPRQVRTSRPGLCLGKSGLPDDAVKVWRCSANSFHTHQRGAVF